MKKLFMALVVTSLVTACNDISDIESTSKFIAKGYHETNADSRTAFDTPVGQIIPYSWSSGDYIWLGANKSDAISEGCKIAQFTFSGGSPAIVGTGHVFYNLTGQSDEAKVLTTQTADGNLGNDGDFGYATIDKFGSFYLKHKTSYIWFDTTTEDANMPKLTSITVHADGVNIAGEQTYDFVDDQWESAVTNGSSTITLNFAGGFTLASSNTGVMAAMVCLPAKVGGETLTITYSFDDGSTFTETKTPSKDFESGKTSRIKTNIAKNSLVKEPSYELRVLTFEDDDVNFGEYMFYNGYGDEEYIETWSQLIPENQWYNGSPLIYNMGEDAEYEWHDANNTELHHLFPLNYGIRNYAGGGMVVSSHTVPFEDLEEYTIYDYQVSVTAQSGHNGSRNFCVAYNCSEVDYDAAGLEKNTLSFSDEARVIDHMYVMIAAPTHYCITYGNSFSSAYGDDDFLKLVATGIKEDGTKTEPIEIMLAEGADMKLTEWTKWDLSGLGKIKAVEFHMEEAQFDTWGNASYWRTPMYFAFDDVAVRFE